MKKKFAVVGYGGMGSWHVNHALKSDVLELGGIYAGLHRRKAF